MFAKQNSMKVGIGRIGIGRKKLPKRKLSLIQENSKIS